MLSRYNVSNPLLPVWGAPSRYAFGVDEVMRRLFNDIDSSISRSVPSARRPSSQPPSSQRPSSQRLYLRDTGEGLHAAVDLPGFRLQDIDLAIEGNTVTLKATAPVGTVPEGFVLLHRERESSDVHWAFEVPYAIEVSAASATLQHGQLSVMLPKAAEAQPRRIAVTGA